MKNVKISTQVLWEKPSKKGIKRQRDGKQKRRKANSTKTWDGFPKEATEYIKGKESSRNSREWVCTLTGPPECTAQGGPSTATNPHPRVLPMLGTKKRCFQIPQGNKTKLSGIRTKSYFSTSTMSAGRQWEKCLQNSGGKLFPTWNSMT